MKYTNIFEKLLAIFNIINSSWIYIIFSLIILVLITLLILKKISKKSCFILISLATKLLLGYITYIYYEPISNLINNIVDNIFLNIYFPSIYAYLFALAITNIITIGNLLRPRGEKVYKTINGICFLITNFIFILTLDTIAKNNIDVFKKESIFTNTNLVTLLEFGINIFIIWLISLLAIYIINNITERIIIVNENRKLVRDPANIINTKLAIEIPAIEESPSTSSVVEDGILTPVQAIIPDNYQNKFIPNFTVDINEYKEENIGTIGVQNAPVIESITKVNYDNNFDLSAFIPKKQEVKPISIESNSINTNKIFEQILNNELPYIKEEPKKEELVEDVKNTYTLNDYRIFNKMLKDIKEHNGSNSVTIDKMLEYRLITKYSSETYNMFKTMLKIYSN